MIDYIYRLFCTFSLISFFTESEGDRKGRKRKREGKKNISDTISRSKIIYRK